MRRRSIGIVVATLFALFGSVAAPPASAQALADSAGTYRFEARAGTNILVQGTMTVSADTVIVDATPGPCIPVVGSSKAAPYRFKCAHVTLSIDRVRPTTKSSAASTQMVIDRKLVCVVEGRDSQGRVICLKQGYESTERDAPVTARVRIVR